VINTISEFSVSQGSAEPLDTWGGTCFLGNASTKKLS